MTIKLFILQTIFFVTALGISNVIKQPHPLDTMYPFVVAIKDRLNHESCGGAIISHEFVLTSADCLRNFMNKSYVIAGSVDMGSGGSVHIVSEIFIHEDYKEGGWDHNIALVKVFPRFKEHAGEHIGFVLVDPQEPPVGTKVSLPGWGLYKTENGSFYPLILQDVPLKTISNKMCNEYNLSVTDKQLCTLTHMGQGACTRDEGFPLVLKSNMKKMVAIATTHNSCGSGFPDVFTKVAPFVGWINDTCKCIADSVLY